MPKPNPIFSRDTTPLLVPCLLSIALFFSQATLAGQEQQATEADPGPQDYFDCKTCDVDDVENLEIRNTIELIAETRWSMYQVERGRVRVKNLAGETATWYWTSEEGRLLTVEPAEPASSP